MSEEKRTGRNTLSLKRVGTTILATTITVGMIAYTAIDRVRTHYDIESLKQQVVLAERERRMSRKELKGNTFSLRYTLRLATDCEGRINNLEIGEDLLRIDTENVKEWKEKLSKSRVQDLLKRSEQEQRLRRVEEITGKNLPSTTQYAPLQERLQQLERSVRSGYGIKLSEQERRLKTLEEQQINDNQTGAHVVIELQRFQDHLGALEKKLGIPSKNSIIPREIAEDLASIRDLSTKDLLALGNSASENLGAVQDELRRRSDLKKKKELEKKVARYAQKR